MRRSSADRATIASGRCPLDLGDGSFSNSHRPSSEGTFHFATPGHVAIQSVDRGLATVDKNATQKIIWGWFQVILAVRLRPTPSCVPARRPILVASERVVGGSHGTPERGTSSARLRGVLQG